MFRFIVLIVLILQIASAQETREMKTKMDETEKAETNAVQVVFMGNSITEGWLQLSPEFWTDKPYLNKGISGQVTSEMLLRFRKDVIDVRPKVVVILAGINDIAQNRGFISIPDIAANIKAMADLAIVHEITVVLCSVLPAKDFPWRPGLEPVDKVIELNRLISAYAKQKDFFYVDYYSATVDENGGLKVPEYTTADDLVHPNPAGYKVMESVLQPILKKALGR